MKLVYVPGDATKPTRTIEGSTIYGPHCCNSAGGWGSGYVNAITARWGESPRGIYKMWHKGANRDEIRTRITERNKPDDASILYQTRFVLGGLQLLGLPDKYVLANMIGQHGTIKDGEERPPIRYAAMAKAMSGLTDYIKNTHRVGDETPCEIHCPKFGSDLAQGRWEVIEAMIYELWIDNGIPVVIYEWVK